MDSLSLFHFIRPAWLLLLPAVAAIWWMVRRRGRQEMRGLRRVIAPHLRKALTVGDATTLRVLPVDLLAIGLISLVLATAGPTWSRQASRWFVDTAPW